MNALALIANYKAVKSRLYPSRPHVCLMRLRPPSIDAILEQTARDHGISVLALVAPNATKDPVITIGKMAATRRFTKAGYSARKIAAVLRVHVATVRVYRRMAR